MQAGGIIVYHLLIWPIVAASAAAELEEINKIEALSATSAQRLAAAVDAASSAASSNEQLAATARSILTGIDCDGDSKAILVDPLCTLDALNQDLRLLLQKLRNELASLFTTGRSDDLRGVLDELASLPSSHGTALRNAAAAVPLWVDNCKVSDALPRYSKFEMMHAELRAIEVEMRQLCEEIYPLRELRSLADGALNGGEDRLGQQRQRRNGDEYVMARYLGSSLYRSELLRTKVAHHLAVAFTAAREEALIRNDSESIHVAEEKLGGVEERLQIVASRHKSLAEKRMALSRQLRVSLKSLVQSCELSSEESAGSVSVSKRFKILHGGLLGVRAQAAEEFSRFLNMTFSHTLPQMVAMLGEVLAPYVAGNGKGSEARNNSFVLPSTWKARPRIGRWWEWLEEQRSDSNGGSSQEIVGRDEFERRFAAAKKRFSVRVSAAEPVVMAYLLWLILEEELGVTTRDGSQQEILALPSPDDVGAANHANSAERHPERGADFSAQQVV